MLDYRGIEALYTVHEVQGFEAAAKKLHISQSAVSQRIKGLETYYGEPLLIRTPPYRLTRLGQQLTGHFKRICLLEDDLEKELGTEKERPRISVALNRDSLETWFLDLIEEKGVFEKIIIDIIADDQELTLNYLKNGLVSACLSTYKQAILGGEVQFLGSMDYVFVASPQFVQKHFSSKTPKQCLLQAPAIKFDQNDFLHEHALERLFGLEGVELDFHIVPSVRGFKQFALMGYGYALIQRIDIIEELKKGQLVEIYPQKVWKTPLYWHYWSIQSTAYQQFNTNIIQYVTQKLKA